MRQRIGLAAPRRSASLHFYVGAAAASFALRSGWHGGSGGGRSAFLQSFVPHSFIQASLPMAAVHNSTLDYSHDEQ